MEPTGADQLLKRLRSRPLVAWIVAAFTVGLAILKAPTELLDAGQKLLSYFSPSANEAQAKIDVTASFILGQAMFALALDLDDLETQKQRAKIETNMRIVLNDAQQRVEGQYTLITGELQILQLHVDPRSIKSNVGGLPDEAIVTLVRQTKGKHAEDALTFGFDLERLNRGAGVVGYHVVFQHETAYEAYYSYLFNLAKDNLGQTRPDNIRPIELKPRADPVTQDDVVDLVRTVHMYRNDVSEKMRASGQ